LEVTGDELGAETFGDWEGLWLGFEVDGVCEGREDVGVFDGVDEGDEVEGEIVGRETEGDVDGVEELGIGEGLEVLGDTDGVQLGMLVVGEVDGVLVHSLNWVNSSSKSLNVVLITKSAIPERNPLTGVFFVITFIHTNNKSGFDAFNSIAASFVPWAD